MPSGSSATSAAPTSLPSSMVLMSFSMVTETISAAVRPSADIAAWQAASAALACSRSNTVSTSSASAPPASRPRAWRV